MGKPLKDEKSTANMEDLGLLHMDEGNESGV